LIARRLMYWQVYLHKTVLSAETMLMNILMRAKELSVAGKKLFATPVFSFFLENDFGKEDFESNTRILEMFAKLDDSDVSASIKVWCDNEDYILAKLSSSLLERKLYRVEMQNEAFSTDYKETLVKKLCETYGLEPQHAHYFVLTDTVNNSAYNASAFKINLLKSNGQLIDVAEASDQLNIQSLSTTVTKHFICYPKDIGL